MSRAALPPTPEDLAWSREIADAVWDAAETLPKPLKDVYILRCVSGLCVKDAAKVLGLSHPGTKTRLFRAQHRMRSEVGRRLAIPATRKAMRSCLSQTTKAPCGLAA